MKRFIFFFFFCFLFIAIFGKEQFIGIEELPHQKKKFQSIQPEPTKKEPSIHKKEIKIKKEMLDKKSDTKITKVKQSKNNKVKFVDYFESLYENLLSFLERIRGKFYIDFVSLGIRGLIAIATIILFRILGGV